MSTLKELAGRLTKTRAQIAQAARLSGINPLLQDLDAIAAEMRSIEAQPPNVHISIDQARKLFGAATEAAPVPESAEVGLVEALRNISITAGNRKYSEAALRAKIITIAMGQILAYESRSGAAQKAGKI